MKIVIGLFLLGLVVLVHEFGHFLAARLCGVIVETFSIGWGPVLLRKKIGHTEYRLSAFPLGGYCGMKGEHAFREALEQKLEAIPAEEGSFYSVNPYKRTIIALAGPLANLLFAVLALTMVSMIGFSYNTYDNRVVPVSTYEPARQTPADAAGLQEGDRIIALNDMKIKTFGDMQQFIGIHPQESIRIKYERNGITGDTVITPDLDKKSGIGRIGVYPYIPLVIADVTTGSAAQSAELKTGDIITAVNGNPVHHYWQMNYLLTNKPEQVTISIQRNEVNFDRTLVMLYSTNGSPETGIIWKSESVIIKGKSVPESIMYGVFETLKTIRLTFKSIGLLFKGVDVTEAVSGPVRITMMIGEAAQTGFAGIAEFLSIICVSLFIMNLLPIPILDGGLILFALIEIIHRKPLKPRTLYVVQFFGMGFIICIFFLALFSDIRFLIK